MTLEVVGGVLGKSSGADNFLQMPSVAGDLMVESGSNADGEWTKWADGTQMFTQYFTGVASISESGVFGTTSGTIWRLTLMEVPHPVVFISPPYIAGTGARAAASTSTRDVVAFDVSGTSYGISLRQSTATGTDVAGGVIAVGRWK